MMVLVIFNISKKLLLPSDEIDFHTNVLAVNGYIM